MIHNAKCELMKDFPDVNEKELLEKIRKEEKGTEEKTENEESKEENNEEEKKNWYFKVLEGSDINILNKKCYKDCLKCSEDQYSGMEHITITMMQQRDYLIQSLVQSREFNK